MISVLQIMDQRNPVVKTTPLEKLKIAVVIVAVATIALALIALASPALASGLIEVGIGFFWGTAGMIAYLSPLILIFFVMRSWHRRRLK